MEAVHVGINCHFFFSGDCKMPLHSSLENGIKEKGEKKSTID